MLQIYSIPALEDNYFWLIQPEVSSSAAYIIDPGAAQPVIDAIQERGLELKGILLTHHHHDHINGAAELSALYSLPVYGPDSPKIPQVTHILTEGDIVQLGSISLEVMLLPGHTLDHIGYYLNIPNEPPRLFSADTLFAAGCGRLFDGTAEQLFASLSRISGLPDDTIIYSAHEYALANLKFALHIEPNNADLSARQADEQHKRQQGLPTVPSLLALEKQTNPFLRSHIKEVRERVELLTNQKFINSAVTFYQLRRLKDHF